MHITMDDLANYYDQLINHDWFYDYSDDGLIWQHGYNEHTRLQGMTVKNGLYAELYKSIADWIYHRTSTKPKRPT